MSKVLSQTSALAGVSLHGGENKDWHATGFLDLGVSMWTRSSFFAIALQVVWNHHQPRIAICLHIDSCCRWFVWIFRIPKLNSVIFLLFHFCQQSRWCNSSRREDLPHREIRFVSIRMIQSAGMLTW